MDFPKKGAKALDGTLGTGSRVPNSGKEPNQRSARVCHMCQNVESSISAVKFPLIGLS